MDKKTIREYQKMINSGICWHLEGSVGRFAMDLIRSGYCYLGIKGHTDYWGNYVPSRFEVKSGTKGSMAFVKQMSKDRGKIIL